MTENGGVISTEEEIDAIAFSINMVCYQLTPKNLTQLLLDEGHQYIIVAIF